MAYNVTIEATNTVEVPEEVQEILLETLEALSQLPKTRQATIDFLDSEDEAENKKAARLFVRQATKWADDNELKFVRKGDISGNPTRVSFRVFKPEPAVEGKKGPGRPKKTETDAE